MQIKRLGIAPAPTEVAVAAFERQLGSELPLEYRLFLKTWGFSSFEKATKIRSITPSLWSDAGYDGMSCFYGLGNGGCNDLLYGIDTFKERIPSDLLAIGADFGDNQICIGLLHGTVPGAVYFWDREEEDNSHRWGNLTLMANSFTEFIERFEEDED